MPSHIWNPATSLQGGGANVYGRAGAPIYVNSTGGRYLRSNDPVFPRGAGSAIEGDPRYFTPAAPDNSSENSSNRQYWEPTDLYRQNSLWDDGSEAFQIGANTDNMLDPNIARWNDEFGWQTPAWNLKGFKNSGMDNFLDSAMWAAVGGGLGGSALIHAGLLGGSGGGFFDALGGGEGMGSGGFSLGNFSLPNFSLPSGGFPDLGSLGTWMQNNPLRALSLGNTLMNALGGGSSGGARRSGSNGGFNMPGILDLLGLAGQRYQGNQNLGQWRNDVNNMISLGTGGVTNDDRAGARGLVRGIYDGSISGDQIFSRVPGLAAMRDRGEQDIMRRNSRFGEFGGDPHSTKDFIDYNNDLVSKAWNSEMDRAMKVGGYNIDPSAMAGQGLRALGEIYGAKSGLDASTWAALNRLMGGQGQFSQGNGSDPWGQLMRSIFGNNSGGDGVDQWESPDPGFFDALGGGEDVGNNFDWWDALGG